MEFRLYGKPNCSVFDLIGDKEPDQTKGLGFLLSESKKAMKVFLDLVSIQLNLKHLDWIVDCESPLQGGRLDVLIRFYDGIKLEYVFIIEAKSINVKADPLLTKTQINGYASRLSLPSDKFSKIMLTHVKDFTFNDVIQITWEELISAFEEKKDDDELIKKYVDYLLKIGNFMKHYDVEVATIPAGKSIQVVEETNIYACPSDYPIVKKHPLYFAFREGGNNGQITKLYKLKACEILDFSILTENTRAYLEANYGNDIIERLSKYPHSEHAYFIFDENETIILPHPVKFKAQKLQNVMYIKLSEVFAQPEKDGCVWISEKSKKD